MHIRLNPERVMRKLFSYIFAVFYLVISTGFTVHVHYCMDSFVKAGLVSEKNHLCGHCGMKKESSNGCCKDEKIQLKGKCDEAILNGIINIPVSIPVVLDAQRVDEICTWPIKKNSRLFAQPHGPPIISGIYLCILNCAFII